MIGVVGQVLSGARFPSCDHRPPQSGDCRRARPQRLQHRGGWAVPLAGSLAAAVGLALWLWRDLTGRPR